MNDELFATTTEKTRVWLNDIMRRLDWDDPHRAWSALRAVLHVLRDRLTVEDAAALGAQLPMLVRGAYYEGWRPSEKRARLRHPEQVYAKVAEELQGYADMVVVEEVTRAVLDVMADHVSVGEAQHLRERLPKDLRDLIPAY